MNSITELLNSLNYDFNSKVKDFQSKSIEMHVTNKTDVVHKNKILAKYLIFDFLEYEDLFVKISNNTLLFNEFQRICISPTFFSHRDDVRWNLYTFIIIKDKEKFVNEIGNLEKDEDYSRKFIFTIEELSEFLENGFLGKIDINKDQKIKTNFVLEWDKILGEYDLNGCLFNKMNMSSIEEYIEKEKPIRPIGRPLSNESKTISRNDLFINRIENIYMDSFRTHCFTKEFSYSPGLINLISGTNGSGKSSLCEAISSGMTGVNMNKVSNSEEIVNIKCLSVNDEIINLSSKKTANEKRECDLAWYGTTTTGYNSNLYENYLIFNYLHSNAAHNGINGNLDVLLKNIMYGEETTKAWEVINNYKEKFIQSQKKYSNAKTKLQDEIKELQSNIEKIESVDRSFELEKSDSFGLLHKYSNDVSYETKYNDLNGISFIVSALEENIKNVSNLNSVPFIINSYRLLKEKKESLEKRYKEYEEIDTAVLKMKIQSESLNFEIKNNLESKIELEKKIVEYLGYDYLYFDNKLDRQKFLNDFYNNENDFKRMKEILNKFNTLKDDKISVVFSENELNQVNNELSRNRQDRVEITNKISVKKTDIELSKHILTEISTLGKTYLKDHSDTGTCPLCGFDYGSHNRIYEAINSAYSLNGNLDGELEQLITQEYKINEVICKLEKRKINLLNDKDIQIKYKEFISEMNKYDILANIDIPSTFYEACCLKKDELKIKIEKNRDIVEFLENLSKTKVFNTFVQQNEINEFSIFIQDALKKYDINKTVIIKNLETISQDQLELQSKIRDAQFIKNEIDKVNKEFVIIQKAYNSANFIIDEYAEFAKVSDIENWILNYNNLKSIVNDLVEAEKNSKTKNILAVQLNGKKQDLENQIKSLSRCKRAISAFNELPTLEENMATFIEDNATNIERIFKMIHRPEEFTDLIIVNGKVQFTRKTTNEIINIENVSTGQAISLIFAITLCLHFSAINAPKFLVLDEPVANLDDMHIMNLVDILKEIALSGVQLFITTANDQVATYFRRKFSCFNEEFKHLEIVRADEKPSIFFEKIYSPNKEEPVVINEIAI